MKDNEKSFSFEFVDGFEDISSTSESEEIVYEDIVSDTSLENMEFVTLEDLSGKGTKDFAKKKRGIAGFFQSFGAWWKKLHKGYKAAIISATAVALIAVLIMTLPYMIYNYNSITGDKDKLGITDIIDEKVVNIALFGIDARGTNSFKGLSDSIMILSLNTETKKVKIISVMRDTLVPMEYKDSKSYNKITTAYSKGGPELAIKTLNQNFNLDISEYATVNFYGMADIIDAVGGIDVTLTEREVSARGDGNHGINDMIEELCVYLGYNPKDYYVSNAGVQHLNGVQAVAYARIRYVPNIWGTNNDYGRTDRQRYVMEQLFNKATQMKKSQYTKMIKALIPCTETSLSMSEIFGLAVDILLKGPAFEQTRIPDPAFVMTAPSGSFGSVVYYDLDYAAKAIHAVIYDDITLEQFIAENPVEKNDWYRKEVGYSSTTTKPSTNSQPSQTENPPTPPETTAPEGSADSSAEGTPEGDASTDSNTSAGDTPSNNEAGDESSGEESTDENVSGDVLTDNTIPDSTVSDGSGSADSSVSSGDNTEASNGSSGAAETVPDASGGSQEIADSGVVNE